MYLQVISEVIQQTMQVCALVHSDSIKTVTVTVHVQHGSICVTMHPLYR